MAGKLRPRRGLHARRLPRADAGRPQDGLAVARCSGCCPAWAQMRDQIENFDEREIDRIEAIIRSMTPAERRDPKILNGSRRARIARGSGTQVVRRQPAGRAVLRGPEDDAPDGRRRRHAGHARDAGHAGHAAAARRPRARRRQAEEGQGRPVRQPGQAGARASGRRPAAREAGADRRPTALGCPTEPEDFELPDELARPAAARRQR